MHILGYSTGVIAEDLDTGANMNEMIKKGAVESSEIARKTLRYECI